MSNDGWDDEEPQDPKLVNPETVDDHKADICPGCKERMDLVAEDEFFKTYDCPRCKVLKGPNKGKPRRFQVEKAGHA